MLKKLRRESYKRKRELEELEHKIEGESDEKQLTLLKEQRDALQALFDYRENGNYGI